MRQCKSRSTNYVLLIICEGIHTEPLFFDAMKTWLKENDIISYDIDILPVPIVNTQDNELDLERGKSGRKKRHLKNETEDQKEVEKEVSFPGPPPLNWVNAGVKKLETYNEVWVVFDKDGHPKTAEAFEKAQTEVNNKRINIAFSSRCFEYYLLLHFEFIYKAFEKSECNEKKYFKNKNKKSKTTYFHCMTDRAVQGKACQGDKCINGYARLKGYWDDSKGTDSMFNVVKDKLWVGIYNAHNLRWMSNKQESDTVFYERNPYIDVDKFICRLLGFKTIEDCEKKEIKEGAYLCNLSRDGNIITISSKCNSHIVIPAKDIVIRNINSENETKEMLQKSIILTPESPIYTIDLNSVLEDNEFCIMSLLKNQFFCTKI